MGAGGSANDDLTSQIERARRLTTGVEQVATSKVDSLQAEDRSFALKFIIRCTFYFIGFVLLFISVAAYAKWDWKEPASVMVEILKIGALPLATFVLGQYFGSAKR